MMNFSAQLMFKTAATITLVLALCLCAQAQTVSLPTPPPNASGIDGKEPSLVKLTAFVLDEKNNFVENLRAEDFVVMENGVPQPVAFFALEDLPVSYTLLIDNTGSMRTMLDPMLRAGETLIAGKRPQNEMAVVRFVNRDKIELLQDFTRNQNALVAAFDQMYVESGETALIEALYVSAEAVAARVPREKGRRALVVLTDGGERDPRSKLDELLTLLRRQHIQVYVLGLTDALSGDAFSQVKGGRKKSRELLETLARETRGRALFPKKPAEFDAAAAALNRELQMPQYVLGYTPTTTAKNNKPVAVQLKLTDSATSARGKLQLQAGFQ